MRDSDAKISVEEYSEHPSSAMQDWKRKIVSGVSLNRAILKLTIPAVGGWYLEFLHNIIDTFWVGKLGPSALAAIGVSTFLLWSIFTLTDIFAAGTSATVARRIGEEKFREATEFAGSVVPAVFAGGILVSIFGLASIDRLLNFVNPSPEAIEYGRAYLRIVFSGAVFVFFTIWCESLFQTNGDAKTPMKILLFSTVLNAALTPALMFGWGFFPRMGVAGAAVGTVVSLIIGSTASFYLLIKKGFLPRNWAGYRPSWKNSWRVIKIGAPNALTGFTFCLVLVFVSQAAAKYGDEPLAAMTVGIRLEELVWVVCQGLYVSAVTVVGQYLGSNEPLNAVKAGWRCMQFAWIWNGLFAAVYFFAGRWLVFPFNSDPIVLHYGALYLKFSAFGLIFAASAVTLTGAMVGAGATLTPMLVTLPSILLRIPAIRFFANFLGWGAPGIFFTMALTQILRGNAMIWVYSRKKWLKAKV